MGLLEVWCGGVSQVRSEQWWVKVNVQQQALMGTLCDLSVTCYWLSFASKLIFKKSNFLIGVCPFN